MNVTYKLDLCYKTKNDRAASPNRNKEYFKSTAQKPTMSKEVLKSVCNLLLFEDYLEDTSISNNTNTPSNTKKRREEMQNQDNSESNLNEALLSVLINLQNA